MQADTPSPPLEVLRSRPVQASLLVITATLVLELTPRLERFRLFGKRPIKEPTMLAPQPSASVGESQLGLETTAPRAAPAATELLPAQAQEAKALEQAPPVPLLDPSDKALDGFFRALSKTARKSPGAITRIAHFGDSIIVSDYVSGTLRRKLQGTFGDAGHGFVLIANAWPSYFHNDVSRYATAGFSVSRIVGPLAADGLYGLGGVSFNTPPNVLSRVGTAESGDFGRRVSSFSLYYLEQPQGGTLELSVDGGPPSELSTAGPTVQSKAYTVKVPDGSHQLSLQTKRGTSRLFGLVLEREGPGIVLDALGIQGARIRFMDKQDDQHWADQLQLRSPNLLVYEFGANESADGFLYPMPDYQRTMREVLEQGKRALPEASCLVIGAMDRAAKVGDEIVSLRVMPELLANQKRAALDAGCAFFDTWTAMGGVRSMPRWVRKGLGQADLTHPTAVGAEIIGTWIYRALMQSYGAWSEAGTVAPAAAPAAATSRPPAE
ncbi:MAG TPA: GDSL-type esterase/lipase family protein [Polyangiaceae bacterium]|nr:GDSL-type esterase/lipase family protein [Polyangiaceae bacterium]